MSKKFEIAVTKLPVRPGAKVQKMGSKIDIPANQFLSLILLMKKRQSSATKLEVQGLSWLERTASSRYK